jgi:hypothetical protein
MPVHDENDEASLCFAKEVMAVAAAMTEGRFIG